MYKINFSVYKNQFSYTKSHFSVQLSHYHLQKPIFVYKIPFLICTIVNWIVHQNLNRRKLALRLSHLKLLLTTRKLYSKHKLIGTLFIIFSTDASTTSKGFGPCGRFITKHPVNEIIRSFLLEILIWTSFNKQSILRNTLGTVSNSVFKYTD